MATCKSCNAPIPDGEEYCENCLKEMNGKENESYLDDLLNQIMSSENNQSTPNEQEESKQFDENSFDVQMNSGEAKIQEDFLESAEKTSVDSLLNKESNNDTENNLADDLEADLMKDSQSVSMEEIQEMAMTEFDNEQSKNSSEGPSEGSIKETEVSADEVIEESQEDGLDSLLGDLLQNMDENEKDVVKSGENLEHKADEEDIMELLNSMNDNEDIFAIDEYMNEQEYPSEDETASALSISSDEKNSDLQDVVQNSVSASPESFGASADFGEADIDEELLKLIPEIDSEEASEPVYKAVSKAETKDGKKERKAGKEKNKAENKGILGKLFGNVREVRTEEEIEQLKQEAVRTVNEKEQQEEEKKAKKIQKQEDKKKKQEDAAVAKKAKKAETAKKKAEKERIKKEAKTKKELEIQNLIDEIDENEGRINRVGASIIFCLFAAFAIFVVIGTNIYSYSINIENASYNFDLQRYNEAYKNVYGMEIKDDDLELYEKIMTVMYVNKQLNSYNHYSAMGKYPEALDSLLKGLERYDKYVSLATMLGIKTDLDYVREQILKELNDVYQLSEIEAVAMNGIEEQAEYSVEVYNVVLERMETTLTKEEQ